MEKRYEVRTETLCDGWINTWSVSEETADNIFTEVPETFTTRKEAQQALDEFLADIQDEIDAGQRDPEDGYARVDFRIAEVPLALPPG